jgi:hypothetical protein
MAAQVTRLHTFAFWFAAEFILYGLIVANGRAYNQGHYAATLVTDMAISAFNFTIGVRFIENADNRNRWAMLGCVLGGGAGSLCSIFLTKMVYGQ